SRSAAKRSLPHGSLIGPAMWPRSVTGLVTPRIVSRPSTTYSSPSRRKEVASKTISGWFSASKKSAERRWASRSGAPVSIEATSTTTRALVGVPSGATSAATSNLLKRPFAEARPMWRTENSRLLCAVSSFRLIVRTLRFGGWCHRRARGRALLCPSHRNVKRFVLSSALRREPSVLGLRRERGVLPGARLHRPAAGEVGAAHHPRAAGRPPRLQRHRARRGGREHRHARAAAREARGPGRDQQGGRVDDASAHALRADRGRLRAAGRDRLDRLLGAQAHQARRDRPRHRGR